MDRQHLQTMLRLLLVSQLFFHASAFQLPSSRRSTTSFAVARPLFSAANNDDDANNDDELNLNSIKADLTRYLAVRKDVGADEAMKMEVGRIVGGTKGNAVLDFVSGAPVKEKILEELPNIFDYSELNKYGFAYLALPIMKSGGRLEMYKLMGLEPPVMLRKEKPKAAPLVFDRTGEQDKGRYGGLKMGLLGDDDMMGEALQQANQKVRTGERMRSKIVEEDYEQPFADKRNVGPQQTPLWTAETLDEEGRKLGRAVDWARQAKAGAFIQDPAEILAIDGSLRVYSVLTSLLVAFAFGRATESVVDAFQLDAGLQQTLQAPALTIVLANIGSSIYSYTQASEKNRSKFVWGVKGLLGGPVAIAQLRGLDVLVTRAEQEQQMRGMGN